MTHIRHSGGASGGGSVGPTGPAGPTMPTLVAAGSTFTVTADTQALYAISVQCDGVLVVDGALVEVN